MKTEDQLLDFLSKDFTKAENLCRICLCSDAQNTIPLFSYESDTIDDKILEISPKPDAVLTLREKLIVCGRVRVLNDDKLPKSICESCFHDLDTAHLFRIKCQKADTLLRKVLEGDGDEVKYEKGIPVKNGDEIKNAIELTQIKQEYDDDSYFDDDATSPLESSHQVLVVKKKKKRKRKNSDDYDDEDGLKLSALSTKHKNCDDNFEICDLKIESDLNGADEFENRQDGGKKFICEICNKCVKTKYILAKHIQVLHGETRSFRIKKPEIGPVTGQGAERRFHCPECDYKCRRRQTLQYHMSTHTGEKPFKCDECPRSFAQHASLYTHKKTHSDKTYYTCQECGRQFKHYGIFKNHRKVHSSEMNFVCTLCNKAMKSQKTLNDHMNRHLQIKQYSCEYCGRSFVTQSCLILHLRVHDKTKERKYKCTFCEFSCYSKGALDIHIKRHTGVRNFPCESCNHMCYTRGELKTHSRKHTKEQNYACPLCDMKFRHSPSLNKHMLKKHGEKFKWSSTIDRRIVK